MSSGSKCMMCGIDLGGHYDSGVCPECAGSVQQSGPVPPPAVTDYEFDEPTIDQIEGVADENHDRHH
jgi:hypothetical protein